MKCWYKPDKDTEPFILNIDIAEWTGFCGGAVAHTFYTLPEWRQPFNVPAWFNPPPKASKEKPWTKAHLLAWLSKQTRGSLILADKKGGTADKYIFPLFPTDGEEFVAGSMLCTAIVSDYYINRNTRNKVRHVVITTKTKPRAKRKEKEATA